MIDIENLSFGYSSDRYVLNNITAHADCNTITALLGINGCGKSTLLRCINGLYKSAKASIRIDHTPLTCLKTTDVAKKISFVPQLTDTACEIIVRDYLVEGRTPHLGEFGIPKERDYIICESYANKVGISDLLDKNYKNLSGGEKQLVSVTRALVQETPIILFDEPLSALDLQKQAKILKLFLELQKLGKTIIFSTHNPNHALLLRSNIWLLSEDRIETDSACNLLTEQKLQGIYGTGIKLIRMENASYCEICL